MNATRRQPATSRYRHVPRIDVHLWGTHMGSAVLDPAYGYYVFAYTEAFAGLGIEPSPLHMPARAGVSYILSLIHI